MHTPGDRPAGCLSSVRATAALTSPDHCSTPRRSFQEQNAVLYQTSADNDWQLEQKRSQMRTAQKRRVQQQVMHNYERGGRPASAKFDTRMLPPASTPAKDYMEQERQRREGEADHRQSQAAAGHDLVAQAIELERRLIERQLVTRDKARECSDYNKRAMQEREAARAQLATEARTPPDVDPNRFFGVSLS